MAEFRKILVANRGEIAIRVMRAANELGKKTVAVYAEEDKLSPAPLQGGRGLPDRRGAGARSAAYLSIPEIIRVAKHGGRRCDPSRLWPSVGKPGFRRCLRSGRASPSSARAPRPCARLATRLSARRVAMAAGVPVIPATEVLGDDMDADQEAGGRGRLSADAQGVLGRRRARHAPDPDRGRAGGQGARRPARGRGRLRQRRGLSRKDDPARPPCRGADPRRQARQHLSPVGARLHGAAPQPEGRRARPCPLSDRRPSATRSASSAKRICAHVDYECAGTVEFLMDMDTGKFYFIEVNPRVQVEHTVTEEVTGIDIVQAQILIAEGKTPGRGDRGRVARTTSS